MPKADHIYVARVGYTHHGIDMGDGTVIHYTGEVGQKANAAVRRTPLAVFARGAVIRVRPYGQCDPPKTVLARARRRLFENRYHLVFNNCEHFATWCKTGKHKSEQVGDAAAGAAGAAGAGTAVAAGLGTVSATGAVAGLSGSGIMSGLATCGTAVGGGAAAGIAVVGLAPAAVTVGAMQYALRDDPALPQEERQARFAGRTATYAGGAVGVGGAVAAVSAAGSVAGLSAAGITSGLAAIGATVGGGMAAGVCVTAAAPAVAAAAVGYGVYRLARWIWSSP
jgi:hypothetical protein